jgi:hypothetical protein
VRTIIGGALLVLLAIPLLACAAAPHPSHEPGEKAAKEYTVTHGQLTEFQANNWLMIECQWLQEYASYMKSISTIKDDTTGMYAHMHHAIAESWDITPSQLTIMCTGEYTSGLSDIETNLRQSGWKPPGKQL